MDKINGQPVTRDNGYRDTGTPAPQDNEGEAAGSFRNATNVNNQESSALDALLAASGKIRGALDKSPALLAKYSDPNDILAIVGADGQLSMSGVGKLTAAKVEQVQNRDIDLKDRMSSIADAVDPRERQSLLNSFQADYTEQLSKDIQKHKSVADDQSGVPQLRAQLVAAEARDKADPLYYKYQSDSTETARIRGALMQAENHARMVAKDLVANDPYINKNNALVTSFIDTENKNIARILQKKDATDAQIEQETSGLTADNLAVIAADYPGKSVEELKRIAYGLKTNPATRKDYAAVFDPSATPEDYATAAVSGIKAVQSYVIQEQARRTGQSPEQVRTDLTNMQSLLNNDGALLEAVKKLGSAEDKKRFTDMVLMHKGEKGKEAQIEWHKTKLAWVMDLQQTMAADRLNRDVKNWQPVNGIALKDIPDVKAIIDRYEVQGKKVGINELMDRFISEAPREQQAERFKLLKDFYSANIDINNNGIYGRIKKDSAMKGLEARFVGSNFFDDLNRVRERANETKPFGLASDQKFPAQSNVDLSATKVSNWLQDQISAVKIDSNSGTVNSTKEDNIYTKPTPAKAKLNDYYNEQGAVLNGMDASMKGNPRLRAAIDAANPSNNVEDRR